MQKHRTPEGLEEHACIDQAVLNLMLDIDTQRPWSEDEIARAISTPGDVRDSLRRLRAAKLIHRSNDLALASHPAVRFHEITQGGNPDSPEKRSSAPERPRQPERPPPRTPLENSFRDPQTSHRTSYATHPREHKPWRPTHP
jgi:hypothetical protein